MDRSPSDQASDLPLNVFGLCGRTPQDHGFERDCCSGVVLRALYDDTPSHTLISRWEILAFLAAVMPSMLAGDGGRPMADAQEERALLGLRRAPGLRSATPSCARRAPRARAASGALHGWRGPRRWMGQQMVGEVARGLSLFGGVPLRR